MSLTKRDLVVRLSKETGIAQQNVYTILQKTLKYFIEALGRGERIEFRDFGVFELQTRKARVGRNPKKPDHVVPIPARAVVKFKPGREMKAVVAALSAQNQSVSPTS